MTNNQERRTLTGLAPYMPSVEEVEHQYTHSCGGERWLDTREQRKLEFYRWRADEIRKSKADALRESADGLKALLRDLKRSADQAYPMYSAGLIHAIAELREQAARIEAQA